MKLASIQSPRFWTASDDALFSGAMSDNEIAAAIGRSVAAVKQRRWKVASGRATAAFATGRPANRLEDVWKYVAIGEADECWPWQAATRRRGYGVFSVEKVDYVAHRVAYQVATGLDPGALFVCHTCDNPPCCNPAHLFLGTHTDNVRDMLTKGRARPPRGEDHHAATLTVEQVREIRRRRAAGAKLIDLAREYGVGDARLSVIVNHPDKAWSHA